MHPRNIKYKRPSGFTIIELLVAIGIMIIIMGITLPMIGAIGRDTGLSNTTNELSASFTAARAVAMKEGKETAVIFRSTGPDSSGPMQLIIAIRNTDTAKAGFAPYEGRAPISLSPGVRIAGIMSLGASPGWVRPDSVDASPTNTNTQTWIGVCFGADGRVKNLDSTLVDPPKDYTNPSKVYYDSDSNNAETITSPYDDQKISFLPILALYDYKVLTDADNDTSPSGLKQFINEALADVTTARRVRAIYFDSYTGQVIK
jgi:type II secretory pathway pseudopilin PulG